MSTEHIIITDKTFKKITSAINKMVDLIRPTFGPASNKVIIDKFPYRMVVDDGVQIARDFELNDPVENAVIKIVREALIRTNDRAGDGTTGAAIMLQAIFNEISRKTKIEGRKIELELKKGLDEVQKELKKTAKQIKTKEELKKVAMVSFDDENIASMIADLYFKLGKDAVITIDKSPSMQTTVETTDGISLKHGYISPYMINNPERMETVFEKPYFLITDYRLTENSDIMPIMEKMASKNLRNLVIISENVEERALATLVINQPQVMNPETRKPGTFPSVALSIPQRDERKIFLEDLALLTGAKVFSVEKGDKLENASIDDLGRSDRFIARRDEAVIISPHGDKQDIKNAISALKTAITTEDNKHKQEAIKQRLAMYTNSLAVIKVGAPTENEQKALKYKVEDCVNAVKSAYQNGVVCGSGLALSRIKTSSQILNEALKYPARQLRENMGLDETTDNLQNDEAINVVTGKKGKFMDIGVVDPVDVLIAAVESAVSIASLLVTSTGMIVETQKKENQ